MVLTAIIPLTAQGAGPLINGNQINPQTAISIATMTVTGQTGLTVTSTATIGGNILMQNGQAIYSSGQKIMTDNGSQVVWISPGSGFLWQNNSGSSNRMTLTDGGNLGVGNAALATKFDVEGNAQFGSGVTKSTFSTTGALTMASGAVITGNVTGNLTGTASNATLAANVTTNANLTGPVTSVGNATTIAGPVPAAAVDLSTVTTALALKVPYSGATSALTMGNNNISTNYGVSAATHTASAAAPTGASVTNTIYNANFVKAYAIFNSTNAAISMRDSFNITSVVYNGVGDVTVNFATPFATIVYGCSCSAMDSGGGGNSDCNPVASGNSSSAMRFQNVGTTGLSSQESKQWMIQCWGRQ